MVNYIKKTVRRLISSPSDNEKQSIIIILAAFLSLTLWFLVTLNQDYDATVHFPVKITNIPDTIELAFETQPYIDLKIQDGGVDLMLEFFKFDRDTLEFAFNQEFLKNKYIETSFYRDQLVQKFSYDIKGINPGRLYFDYENKIYKRVPLYSRTHFRLAPAFFLENQPAFTPDSVTILGPLTKLDSIKEWYTANITTKVIIKSEEVTVPVMDSIKGLKVTPKTVKAFVKPQKYTQADMRIPINVYDVPEGSSIRLEVDSLLISCLVPMARYESVLNASKSYKASVSFYNLDPLLAHTIPQPSLPDDVKLVSQNPFRVNFVIVNK